MRIVVLGAGNVGRAVVDALYEDHAITVIDTDAARLAALSERYDVRAIEGNGTTREVTFALGGLGLTLDARRGGGAELTAFEAFGAAAACLGNVGPAFGFAGPYGSFEPSSDLSTAICTGLMWLGRVEIIPVAVLLTRSCWRV